MSELKPCPFCGGIADFVSISGGLAVKCTSCGVKTDGIQNGLLNYCKKGEAAKRIVFHDLYYQAAKQWNRRFDHGDPQN